MMRLLFISPRFSGGICGHAAIYFDPKNPSDISNKIIHTFRNQKLKKALVEKGYNQINIYNWGKTFKNTLEYIIN